MSLKTQSVLIFAASLLQLLFSMVAGIVAARFLGPEGKGIALLAFFVPGFLTSLGTFSLGEASLYYLGRGTEPGRILTNTIIQSLGLGALYIAAALLFLGPLRSTVVKDVPLPYVVTGLLTLPLMLLKNYGDGVLVGMGRVRSFVVGNLTLYVTRAVLLVAALPVCRLGVAGAVGAEFATWILTGGVYLGVMLRGVPLAPAPDWSLVRDQFRYGFQAHVGNIAQRLNLQVSTVVLSSLTNPASVGFFSVAVNVAQVLWYVPDSVGRLLLPRVASLGPRQGVPVTQTVCRNVILVTAAAAASLFLVGPPLIRILYGAAFQPSIRPLFLLVPGILALTVAKVLTKYLSGIGKPFLNSVASVTSFAVNAPLLYVMVRAQGLDGAALASSIAYGVHAAVVLFFFLRESRASAVATLVPTASDLRLWVESAGQLWRRLRRPGTVASP